MKLLNITALGLSVLALSLFSSCIDDKTTNADTDVNIVEFENFENSYTAVAHEDHVKIEPKLKGSVYGDDDSKYRYQWTLTQSVGEKKVTTTIGTEKNLDYLMDHDPATYTISLRVYDTTNGMLSEKSTTVTAVSPFVKGYYIYGAKPDGQVAMDFVSFIEGRDTMFFRDIYKNELKIKNPKNLIFTGYDGQFSYSGTFRINLIAVADQTVEVEGDPTLSKFGDVKKTAMEDKCFPTIPVSEPMHLVTICPLVSDGSANTNRTRTRFAITDNELFGGSFTTGPEIYGNPCNRYSTTSSELFKPAPFVFFKNNAYGNNFTDFMLYDLTNHTFCCLFSVYSAPSACSRYSESADIATSETFYWNQNKYKPVRDLVYGFNASLSGNSYALMKDTENSFFVYQFQVGSQYSASKKIRAYNIDKTNATDMDKATFFAFFTKQPYLLYTVGSKLYVVNYATNKCVMAKDFGDEITYMGMDRASTNSDSEFRVCTYSDANKGNIYKYAIKDDVNNIVVEQLADHWKTDLRVVKLEYRNSTAGQRNIE